MKNYNTRMLFCFIFFQIGCSTAATEIYPYEPAIVQLQGVLELEEKFGPPNFGEFPETDQRLNIYVLNLIRPIHVGTPDSLSELNDRPIENVSRIQVIFQNNSSDIISLIGETIVLEGSLSKQLSSHDFYPVQFRVF
ncbi:MAG: hypothetical protein Q8L60_15530 [Gammaproteobacteria bacterium]|nr:hypothetical protein [Gammaproteobacteria bacterium]MDP2346631.1 hypothetical protein [Gammaproteobacteria bacterium]